MGKEFNENFNKIISILERIEMHVTALKGNESKLIQTGLLDNQDLCIYLKVSKRTLQRYRRSGKLPFHRIGQKTFYLEDDVKEFLRLHFNKDE